MNYLKIKEKDQEIFISIEEDNRVIIEWMNLNSKNGIDGAAFSLPLDKIKEFFINAD